MATYPMLGIHVSSLPGATMSTDLGNVQVNGIPFGTHFALLPLEFASSTLNGSQQQTSSAATQSGGTLLQPVPVLRYVAPHFNSTEQHTQSRQSASNRYEVNPATQANQYTLLAHNAGVPVIPFVGRRDEPLLTVGNPKMFSLVCGEEMGASRSVGSKPEADSEHVANDLTRQTSSSAKTRHANAQMRAVNADVVDGCSLWATIDRSESNPYAYVSQTGETFCVDANNNETSGFVEPDMGSSMTTPLNSASGEKHRSGPLSLSDAQHNNNDSTRTSRWNELGTDVANTEASTSPNERRRESTPIGTSSGSEGESESKREELDGAIADVSAVGPDSPRSTEGDNYAPAAANQSANKQWSRPEVEPAEASRLHQNTARAYVLNVHSEPWYPPNLRPIAEKSLPARDDKENFACPLIEVSYSTQINRSDALDSFAADMSRSLVQTNYLAQPHLAHMWGHFTTPSNASPSNASRNSQPLSHARRNPPSAHLLSMPVAGQPGVYVFPHAHLQANGHDGIVQPQTQTQPKRIRLSASGAAALQLNNIDINRFATVAPLSYGTEQHAPASHGIAPPAFPPPHACRPPPSSAPGAPGSAGPGEDKVAANMKRLFTKIVETFDGLTADDAISIIRQVKIKRNGLKGLTMKTILSDAIEIVKEMNAMAGAPQQTGPVPIVPAQAHEMTQLGMPSGISMPAAWNGKTAGLGERRGVISLARPAHEEPCLDVNCTDFLQYCKYKTELCAQQQAAGRCKMGAKCVYAHGAAELRPIRKLRMCNGMAKYGYCAYGDKCLWAHSEAELYHETLDDRLAWYHAGRPACLTIADAHRAPSMAPHPLGIANAPATPDATDGFEPVWASSQTYVDDQQRLALSAGRPRLSALQNIAPAAEHRVSVNQEALNAHYAPAATRAWCAPTPMPGKTQHGAGDNALIQNALPCLICGCSLRLRRPRTIECGHEFHDDCIRRWTFTQDLTCPICGRSIAGLSDSPSAFGVHTAGVASTR